MRMICTGRPDAPCVALLEPNCCQGRYYGRCHCVPCAGVWTAIGTGGAEALRTSISSAMRRQAEQQATAASTPGTSEGVDDKDDAELSKGTAVPLSLFSFDGIAMGAGAPSYESEACMQHASIEYARDFALSTALQLGVEVGDHSDDAHPDTPQR